MRPGLTKRLRAAAKRRVGVLLAAVGVEGVLVFKVVSVVLAGVGGDDEARVQSFQLHAGRCHGEEGARLVSGAGVYVRPVGEDLRIVAVHPADEPSVLLGPFGGKLAVAVATLGGQLPYHAERSAAVGA